MNTMSSFFFMPRKPAWLLDRLPGNPLFKPFFGNFKKPVWYNVWVKPKRRDRFLTSLA